MILFLAEQLGKGSAARSVSALDHWRPRCSRYQSLLQPAVSVPQSVLQYYLLGLHGSFGPFFFAPGDSMRGGGGSCFTVATAPAGCVVGLVSCTAVVGIAIGCSAVSQGKILPAPSQDLNTAPLEAPPLEVEPPAAGIP